MPLTWLLRVRRTHSGPAEPPAAPSVPEASFLDGLPLPAARVDAQGNLAAINRALATVLARPPEALVGLPLAHVLVPDGHDDTDGGTVDIAEIDGTPVRLRHADGTALSFQARLLPDGGDGGTRLLCLLDIEPVLASWRARSVEETERALEAELAEQRRRLLRQIGHDLRSPVAAMRLEMEILRRRLAQTGEDSALDRIEAGLDRLRHLVDALTDSGGPDSDEPPILSEERVDELVAAACDAVRARAEERGLDLHGSTDLLIRGEWQLVDRRTLLRVLRLLLDNAIRFTRKGEVSLRAEPAYGDEWLAFVVADTGPGIPPEKRRRVFEELYQVSNEARRPGSGYGLGLSIAARLARSLGGEIRLESEVGVGSRFTLLIPRTPVAEKAPLSSGAGAATRSLRGLRVLIADDDASSRRPLADLLDAEGCEVEQVEDGEQALAALRAHAPEVLVIDLMMPRMDGVEVLRHAHREGLLTRTAVLVITGDTREDRDRDLRSVGSPTRLLRPVSYEEVRQGIVAALIKAAEVPRVVG